jgi:hypothetical protein
MSIFDHPDDVPTVATWRCPHCATLQPESTRCWACDRSPMTCATCRYYRRSVIGPVGFCGLDRTRALLAGDEVRACWQAPTDLVDLVSDRPGSGRTSWLTLAERQRSIVSAAAPPATAREEPDGARPLTPMAKPLASDVSPPDPQPRGRAVATPAALVAVSPGPAMATSSAPLAADGDDLVEAPVVRPARKVVSEAQRRAAARRERGWSADDREDLP